MTNPVRSYFNSDIYAHEIDHIYGRHWLCVGNLSQLRNDNDFVVASVGNRPVIIQNFSGTLRAFLNICSHRHALLHRTRCGTGPIRCHYHGWSYNQDGIPAGIPRNQETFGISEEDRRQLALPSFPVETCGNFVFVRGTNTGPKLRDWLGPYCELLENVSRNLTDRFETKSVPLACNWKLAVENAIESYHVSLVHAETLAPAVDSEWTSYDFGPAGTYHESAVMPRSLTYWNYAADRLGMTRSTGCNNLFRHYVVYPNLLIGLTHGALMSVQTIEPTGPEACLLNYSLFLGGSNLGPEEDTVFREEVRTAMRTVTDVLLQEDKDVAESAQRGAHNAVHTPLFGRGETRIARFHEWVQSQL